MIKKQAPPPEKQHNFRTDINGLRAYAVVAVLLFHFQIAGFNAGFLGVDIFFVISGFLMTSIIVKGLEKESFSIWKFYMARVRRIVPALMVVIATLLILGWVFLPTPDYQALGSQSVFSSAFLSNIYFWRSSGYFDSAAHEKWLLHTWTLGIEAQFYLLLPLFLIFLWKIKPTTKTLLYGLVCAFFISLALSIVVSTWKPVAAFYLLPTRGWEFIAGGLVFFAGRDIKGLERFSRALLWSGFSLLLIAFILIDSSYTWPSAWALLPVLATSLIILAQQSRSILTSHPVAQWLGERSYSLYLWHWPIVVALYFAGLHTEWLWISFGLMLSFLLSDLSYRVVETPTRVYFSRSSMHREVAAIGTLMLLVGVSAVSVRLFVFEERPSKFTQTSAIHGVNRAKDCVLNKNEHCFFNTEDAETVLLIGDSHAGSVFNAFGLASKNNGYNPVIYNQGGCPTIANVNFTNFGMEKSRPKDTCEKYYTHLISAIKNKKPPKIVIVNRMQYYFNGPNELSQKQYHGKPLIYIDKVFKEFNHEYEKVLYNSYYNALCEISKLSDEVYVTRPIPEMEIEVAKEIYRKRISILKSTDIKIEIEKYNDRNSIVWSAQDKAVNNCNIKILDPTRALCDDVFCYGSKEIKPLYNDNNHLNDYGASFLMPMFEEIFKTKNKH